MDESTIALELSPNYVKALMRRAQAQEKLDEYDEAVMGMLQKIPDSEALDLVNLKVLRAIQQPASTFLRIWLNVMLLYQPLKREGNAVVLHFV